MIGIDRMFEKEYDVVIDVLQKHYDKLTKLTMQNMNSDLLGLNIMDDIRIEQCSQLKEAMELWLNRYKK